MRSLTPWTGMGSLKHEMDRVFDRFLEGKLGRNPCPWRVGAQHGHL